MKNNFKFNPQTLIIISFIILASLSRFIPHIQNFSPIGAISLFGAAFFKSKWKAFLIPISATWISDLFLNNIIYSEYYSGFTWFYEGSHWQFFSYALIILLGLSLYKNNINLTKLGLGAFGSTLIFFLVSNFGVWFSGVIYTKNFAGLVSCYVAGIPFLKGTVLGNLFYVPILFGSYYLMEIRFPSLRKTNVHLTEA